MKNKNFNKVFFDPGYIPLDEVATLVRNHECLKLIRHRKRELNLYRSKSLDIQCYPDYKDHKFSQILEHDVENVWSKIINDHQTSVLFDRTTKSGSEAFKFNELLLMCCAYQQWLETEKPDLILFTVTPHNIKTWALSRVAESIGIPVLFFQVSFFPWRQFLLEGLRKDARIILPLIRDKEPSEQDRQFYSEYMRKKMGSLENAMPAYEIDRLKKNGWKLMSVKSEFRNFMKEPLRSIEKVKSYNTYEALSKEIPDGKYVAFFLHYQPERTTIPEGYGFGVQLAAILALQQSLPDGTCLVVKEHPSTYTYNFSKKYRNRGFYELIASIDRVILSPITADPYRIIDNSIATASITGTVIGEALVRGKPGIAFGAGPIQSIESPCFHRYKSIAGLRDFLANLGELERHDSEKYFADICGSTFSGMENSSAGYDDKARVNYLSASAISGINQLLSGRTTI